MAGLTSPRTRTIKRLFAVSGNRCAFPACTTTLVDGSSGKVTGRVCHIRAARQRGPRFDPTQTDEERHGFDNLILMCPIHHDVVDSDEASYTAERLRQLKAEREADQDISAEPSDEVAEQLIANIGSAAVTIDGPAHGPVIISHGQTGGQTAQTINNYGQIERRIDPGVREKMESRLRSMPSRVGFASTQGDAEADSFKKLLIDVFRSAGWEVRDMATFMFFGSKKGLVVTIPFGDDEDGPVQVVAQALSETGNPVSGNRGDMAKDCGIYVQVWHAP